MTISKVAKKIVTHESKVYIGTNVNSYDRKNQLTWVDIIRSLP